MKEDDWLNVETPEDWLSTEPTSTLPAVIEDQSLKAAIKIPEGQDSKVEFLQNCWKRLMPKQQTFIMMMRDCRWNERAAIRALENTSCRISRSSVRNWLKQDDYALCVKVLRQDDAGEVLDTDKLLLRQDDIVEQLMTPTPILHQGEATGFFENRAPAASKANEVLMKAAGLLKNDDKMTRHVVRFVNLAGPEVETAIEVATEIT